MPKVMIEKDEEEIIDSVLQIEGKPQSRTWKAVVNGVLVIMAIGIAAVLIWQGMTASGNPDPTGNHLSRFAVVMDTGILVFREGLEAILVLAALTASLVRTSQGYWKPVSLGAGLSFLASIATWFIVVGIISHINAPELDIQAANANKIWWMVPSPRRWFSRDWYSLDSHRFTGKDLKLSFFYRV
jgi:hypothetical protein